MIVPCLCRGTSQYTHEACLQRYFEYYPDRVCRICSARMEYLSLYDRLLPCLFVPVLSSLIVMSSASVPAKVMLTLGLLGLAIVFALHPVFKKDVAMASVILGTAILCIQPQYELTFWVVGFLGVAGLVRTLVHYLDPMVLLTAMTCCMAMAYLTLFSMSLLIHLDRMSTAILVVQMFLVWNSFLQLRPGLRRNPA